MQLFESNLISKCLNRILVNKGVVSSKSWSSHQRCSIKKETLAQVFFPLNFAKFLRTPFLQNTPGWLLLEILGGAIVELGKRFFIGVGLLSILRQCKRLTIQAPTPQNGQTHPNNSSAKGDELFKCVWSFCGIGV